MTPPSLAQSGFPRPCQAGRHRPSASPYQHDYWGRCLGSTLYSQLMTSDSRGDARTPDADDTAALMTSVSEAVWPRKPRACPISSATIATPRPQLALIGIKIRCATHDHIVRDGARPPDRTGSLGHHDVIGRRPLQAEDDTGIRGKWHHTEPDLSIGERLPEVDSFLHLIGRNVAIGTDRDGEACSTASRFRQRRPPRPSPDCCW